MVVRVYSLQSMIAPFTPGPIPGLNAASCISIFLFLCAADLAVLSLVSSKCTKFAKEAVHLACICLYNRRTPVSRKGESATRLLQFIESVGLVQELAGLAPGRVQVASGMYHNVMLSAQGKAYGFGDSAAGQVRLCLSCASILFLAFFY